jgi:hypothetical protein
MVARDYGPIFLTFEVLRETGLEGDAASIGRVKPGKPLNPDDGRTALTTHAENRDAKRQARY